MSTTARDQDGLPLADVVEIKGLDTTGGSLTLWVQCPFCVLTHPHVGYFPGTSSAIATAKCGQGYYRFRFLRSTTEIQHHN